MNSKNKNLQSNPGDQYSYDQQHEIAGAETYRLYTDDLLLRAARDDVHLDNLLEGVRLADVRQNEDPSNPVYQHVAGIAEEATRDWIKRQGLMTSEQAPPDIPDVR